MSAPSNSIYIMLFVKIVTLIVFFFGVGCGEWITLDVGELEQHCLGFILPTVHAIIFIHRYFKHFSCSNQTSIWSSYNYKLLMQENICPRFIITLLSLCQMVTLRLGKFQELKSSPFKHNFETANSRRDENVCKWRKAKTTWGENNNVYSILPRSTVNFVIVPTRKYGKC